MDRGALKAKITPLEIEAAIFAFPPHKAPGPDGFPAGFYKTYEELLVPQLRALFAHCLEQPTLPSSMLVAYRKWSSFQNQAIIPPNSTPITQ